MGDGNLYGHKKDIQYIQCRTCHGTLDELPLTAKVESPDDLAMRLAFLNPVIDLQVGDTILVTEKGEPLWNTRQLPDGTYELFDKVTGERFTFRPVKGTACLQKPDQQRICVTATNAMPSNANPLASKKPQPEAQLSRRSFLVLAGKSAAGFMRLARFGRAPPIP